MSNIQLTKDTSEDEIGKVLDSIRSGELSRNLLVELLSERHAVYSERPGYQMIRIKGYALASFAEVGLPDSAINFVLDELQNGRNAYMVAAAARGLCGSKRPKAQYANFLIQAVNNLRYHDDSLDLTQFRPEWPLRHPSSGKLEIFRALQWLRGYAKVTLPELNSFLNNNIDFNPEIRKEIQATINAIESDDRELDLSCCEVDGRTDTKTSWLWKRARTISNIEDLEVQNEVGRTRPLKDVIDHKPTVIAFFYTRCMNPNKCTLTINKMGWLQKALMKKGLEDKVTLIAFTYDPTYDDPAKMHTFGENRGITFGSNTHLLRTRPEDFDLLSDFFQLGVNHVSSMVNQHRLELYMLDQNGHIKTTYTRLQWDVEKVTQDLDVLINKSSKNKWLLKITNSIQQVAFPILVAFFPKCPFCWAAYLSALGISGIQTIPYSPWIAPLIILVMIFNLVVLYRKSKVRNGLIPFWISLAGVLMVSSGYLLSVLPIAIPGIILIFIGAILNSLSYKHWSKICFLAMSIFHRLPGTKNSMN
ncbi:SCO family protein [Chryseobacterium sp. MYb264]|uniref:SCO family protein n=1 Tax=Chryseobacterium sp. MYb264 TaxID=2745153 RepID=UPI002E105209|nr:SCO family protein [Chryseobacterium sp. MYb264]